MAALSLLSYLLVFAVLAALAWRDAKEYILPDRLNATLALAFAAFHISLGWTLLTPLAALAGAVAGGGFLLIVRAIADKFYRPDSLGLGDVKLMAAAGIGLGFPDIFMALTLGAAAGAVHGLALAAIRKKSPGDINVPAGPGLALGIAAVFLWQYGFNWMTT